MSEEEDDYAKRELSTGKPRDSTSSNNIKQSESQPLPSSQSLQIPASSINNTIANPPPEFPSNPFFLQRAASVVDINITGVSSHSTPNPQPITRSMSVASTRSPSKNRALQKISIKVDDKRKKRAPSVTNTNKTNDSLPSNPNGDQLTLTLKSMPETSRQSNQDRARRDRVNKILKKKQDIRDETIASIRAKIDLDMKSDVKKSQSVSSVEQKKFDDVFNNINGLFSSNVSGATDEKIVIELQRRLDDANSTIETQQTNHSTQQTILDELNRENSDLKQQLQDLNVKLSELQTKHNEELQKFAGEQKQLAEESSGSKDRVQLVERTNRELSDTNSALNLQLQQTQAKLGYLEEQLKTALNDRQSAIQEYTAKTNALELEYQQRMKTMELVKTQMEIVLTDLRNEEKKGQTEELSEISEFKLKMENDLKLAIQSLKADVYSQLILATFENLAKSWISNFKERVALKGLSVQQAQNIEKLKGEKKNLKGEKEDLTKENSELSRQLTGLVKLKDQIEKELNSLKQKEYNEQEAQKLDVIMTARKKLQTEQTEWEAKRQEDEKKTLEDEQKRNQEWLETQQKLQEEWKTEQKQWLNNQIAEYQKQYNLIMEKNRQSELDQLNLNHSKEIASKDEIINGLNKKYNALEEKINKDKEDVDMAAAHGREFKKSNDELDAKMAELAKQQKDLEEKQKLCSEEGSIFALQNQLRNVKSERDEYKYKLDEKSKEEAKIDSIEVKKLEEKLSVANFRIKALENDKKTTESEWKLEKLKYERMLFDQDNKNKEAIRNAGNTIADFLQSQQSATIQLDFVKKNFDKLSEENRELKDQLGPKLKDDIAEAAMIWRDSKMTEIEVDRMRRELELAKEKAPEKKDLPSLRFDIAMYQETLTRHLEQLRENLLDVRMEWVVKYCHAVAFDLYSEMQKLKELVPDDVWTKSLINRVATRMSDMVFYKRDLVDFNSMQVIERESNFVELTRELKQRDNECRDLVVKMGYLMEALSERCADIVEKNRQLSRPRAIDEKKMDSNQSSSSVEQTNNLRARDNIETKAGVVSGLHDGVDMKTFDTEVISLIGTLEEQDVEMTARSNKLVEDIYIEGIYIEWEYQKQMVVLYVRECDKIRQATMAYRSFTIEIEQLLENLVDLVKPRIIELDSNRRGMAPFYVAQLALSAFVTGDMGSIQKLMFMMGNEPSGWPSYASVVKSKLYYPVKRVPYQELSRLLDSVKLADGNIRRQIVKATAVMYHGVALEMYVAGDDKRREQLKKAKDEIQQWGDSVQQVTAMTSFVYDAMLHSMDTIGDEKAVVVTESLPTLLDRSANMLRVGSVPRGLKDLYATMEESITKVHLERAKQNEADLKQQADLQRHKKELEKMAIDQAVAKTAAVAKLNENLAKAKQAVRNDEAESKRHTQSIEFMQSQHNSKMELLKGTFIVQAQQKENEFAKAALAQAMESNKLVQQAVNIQTEFENNERKHLQELRTNLETHMTRMATEVDRHVKTMEMKESENANRQVRLDEEHKKKMEQREEEFKQEMKVRITEGVQKMVEFAQRFTTTAASNQQSYQHTERVNQQTIDNLVTRQEFDNMRADLTFKHTQLIEGLKTKTLITSAVAKGSVQTNIPTRLSSSSSSSSSSYQSVPIASPSGQILWLPNIATNSWMHRLFRFLILSSGMSGCDQAVFILPHWVELLTNVHVNGQWIMKDDWDIENYIEQFKKEAKDSVDQVASGIAEVNLERLRLRKIDIQERRENLEKFAGALKELSKQQEWGTRGPKDDDVLTETMLPLLATSTGMAAIKTALCKITLARLNKGKYYTLKGILSDTEMTTWFSRYVGCQYIDLTIRGGQVKSADVIARAKMNEQNALSCRMYFDPPKPIK